ncbi:MAG: ATP-binding cassette domain-containing protein [Deltaproteobacteria bacterium]|nr:ATP-binding cassette domain-containing protein [Deltaproteobacteria bacterium]
MTSADVSEAQPALLRCVEVGAWYAAEGAPSPVMQEVSFALRAGEILGVFGPNGCGKSTLLRLLLGLHRGRSGQVLLEPDARVTWIPQRLRESFFTWASLRTNIALTRPAGDAPWRAQLERVEQMREELGLELDLRLRPGRASDGMLQQAAMLRALAPGPQLLLADEPFSSLDVGVARRLRGALRRRVSGGAMGAVLVLHDLESLVTLADRVLVIEQRPFTTALAGSGVHRARLLQNHFHARRDEPSPGSPGTFFEVVERLLAESGHA